MPALRMSPYRHVFVLKGCLDIFRRESNKVRFRETGGALIGYVSNDGALVITGASGPGPRAELRRYSVTIDGSYATEFCAEAHRNSGYRIDYVGDWHRHLGLSLTPSGCDIQAMRAMGMYKQSPSSPPVSLIYRKWAPSFKVYLLNPDGVLTDLPFSLLDTTLPSLLGDHH